LSRPGSHSHANETEQVEKGLYGALMVGGGPMNSRLMARNSVEQLARDGSLRAYLEPTIAADLLWAFTSLRTWEDLVLVRGWTAAQYEERLVATLLRVLTNTSVPDTSSISKRRDAVRSQRR